VNAQARGAGAYTEEVLKVICGRNEICNIFEVSFDGEQKTLKRGVRGMVE